MTPPLTVPPRLLALVLPALAQQYLFLFIQNYDQYLARGFGVPEQAALTTANYLYWLTSCYSVVVSAGATALVGRSFGAGDRVTANRAAGQSLLLAVVFGLLATAAAFLGLPSLMHALNLEGAAPEIAVEYLSPLAALLTVQLLEIAGIACLVGAGDTRTGLMILSVVTVVNVPVGYALSRGWAGAPNLGFVGIAWGTAASHTAGGLLILTLLVRGRSGLKVTRSDLWPDMAILARLLRVSVPAALDSISGGLCQLWFLRIVNALGPAAAAAHGIALRWEGFGYLAGAAFGTAASAMISQNLGAGRPDRAARAGWRSLLFATIFMSVVGCFFYTLARPMCELFSPDNPAVVDLGVTALRTVAFAMPALAALMILTSSLRSAGDSRMPMFVTWAGFLLVRIPLAYLFCGEWYLGLFGAWLAMLIDLWVRGMLILLRFAGGRWKRIAV